MYYNNAQHVVGKITLLLLQNLHRNVFLNYNTALVTYGVICCNTSKMAAAVCHAFFQYDNKCTHMVSCAIKDHAKQHFYNIAVLSSNLIKLLYCYLPLFHYHPSAEPQNPHSSRFGSYGPTVLDVCI